MRANALKHREAGLVGVAGFLNFSKNQDHLQLLHICVEISGFRLVPPLPFLRGHLALSIRVQPAGERAINLLEPARCGGRAGLALRSPAAWFTFGGEVIEARWRFSKILAERKFRTVVLVGFLSVFRRRFGVFAALAGASISSGRACTGEKNLALDLEENRFKFVQALAGLAKFGEERAKFAMKPAAVSRNVLRFKAGQLGAGLLDLAAEFFVFGLDGVPNARAVSQDE